MIHRIFDRRELPCGCHVRPADGEPFTAEVVRVSQAKAIVAARSAVELETESSVSVTLTLEGGPEMELEATVLAVRQRLVFVTWAHADPQAAWDLQDTLVAYSRELEEGERSDDDLSELLAEHADELAEREAQLDAELESATGVNASILRRTKRIRSSDLAARHSSVRVMGMSQIVQLIQEAVDEALESTESSWNEEQRQRLREEAEEAFNERLEAMKAEKAGLEAQTKTLGSQLERAQELLTEEQNKVVSANQFTVSDAGMIELEQRIGRLIDHSLKSGEVSSTAEDEMRNVVSRLLDDEREKIREQAEAAQTDTIALLERKVERLANTLENAESARLKAERRAKVLETSSGTSAQNIYAAGLDETDPEKERKLDLLREIIQVNREVRQHIIDLGGTLATRRRPELETTESTGDREPESVSGPSDPPPIADQTDEVPVADPRLPAEDTDLFDDEVSKFTGGAAALRDEDEELDDDPAVLRPGLDGDSDDGVKKIEVARVAPPPLERAR